jgi:hypothetical protein
VECHLNKEKVSRQVCNNPINYLPTRKVNIFQQLYCHHFELGKQKEKNQLMFIMLTQMLIKFT